MIRAKVEIYDDSNGKVLISKEFNPHSLVMWDKHNRTYYFECSDRTLVYVNENTILNEIIAQIKVSESDVKIK